jgi:hypothetical protein
MIFNAHNPPMALLTDWPKVDARGRSRLTRAATDDIPRSIDGDA